jgi:hypothetical protein
MGRGWVFVVLWISCRSLSPTVYGRLDEALLFFQIKRWPCLGSVVIHSRRKKPKTEPKEPGTGTEGTGTEKIGSCSVLVSLEPNYHGSFGSVPG